MKEFTVDYKFFDIFIWAKDILDYERSTPLGTGRWFFQNSKEVAGYTGPEDASPWVYAGNILEEQKAELPADCYAAPGPVPESNNNKQPHSNPLLAGPLTKSQMQDNLSGIEAVLVDMCHKQASGLGHYLTSIDPSLTWRDHVHHVLIFCLVHFRRGIEQKFRTADCYRLMLQLPTATKDARKKILETLSKHRLVACS
ncbi:hypothetical protein V8E54_013325 [Elaphomyces granulatus]